MPLKYTDEHEIFRRSLRKFFEAEVKPNVEQWRKQGFIPREIWKKMGAQGFIGYWLPPEFGGSGLDFSYSVVLSEEMVIASSDLGVNIGVHNDVALPYIAHSGTEEQKQKYLPKLASGEWIGCFSLTEPGSGSDAGAARCTAVEDANGWVINGTKNFVTNGREAHVIVLFAVTDADNPRRRMSAFIVEKNTPGCTLGKLEKKLGIKASSTAELIFENCRVPKDALLGERGKGLRVALGTLDGGRIGVACQAVGLSQAALDCAVEYAKTRVQFNQPIGKFQAIQWKLADMATAVAGARLLTYRAAWLKQNRQPYSPEAAMAKLYASEASNRVTDAAIQVYGGYGYCADYPAERLMRDARITELYEGTSEIQRLVIARKVIDDPAWVSR